MLFSPDDDYVIAVAHGLRCAQCSEVNLPFLKHAYQHHELTSTHRTLSTSLGIFATIQKDKLYIKKP